MRPTEVTNEDLDRGVLKIDPQGFLKLSNDLGDLGVPPF